MVVVGLEQLKQLQHTKTIGIIGLGDMGAMYARRFSDAGWTVVGCDQEDAYESVKHKFANHKFEVVKNGHYVSRVSDYVIYSVEAKAIGKVIATYAPSSKYGAIIGGQTSCKEPEVEAFEQYCPSDIKIITVHSLHGPNVNPVGQPLVLIKHRANDDDFDFVESLMSCLKSKHVYLTAKQHDQITADTQAVTHAAFLSMGSAWRSTHQYPWETPRWSGGIENAKMNISMRIFSNKWHVYAGLAITNPSAHTQILQYSKSASELFSLMIQGKREDLRARLLKARSLFKHINENELLLDDNLLEKYSLSQVPPGGRQPNSHLSLLAIADTWISLGVVPYDHIICSTPLFRIFLGVTEYLFCTPGLLEESIEVACSDPTFRTDDLEFVIAARQWSDLVTHGNYDLYRTKFEDVQQFFSPMLKEANSVGNEMIKIILARVHESDERAKANHHS
ncbi:prephenate dehydrogenase (NADP(+)) [Yamadazyma tenuis]|uniref:Prephenate dehydrogenase [NADP(+)] n=1 Tax=Candida tenuis (strain ATCC 10573 / BCRC 21748 / CBS 615 / JCM 9827 / NBRC 10315 / NRRL Y-1498 / VKM Y-70) TaxID=590646 RepID=G3B6D5_CANTC|nr:Prephenate dehydrogenase [Yamadazyma tenuis ATCC 10573]EGV63441.1 Prephenate dehydrogenase [Yamadazyma tenuis ATCC 10573]WEJ96732.1 prephenate dehydrogenase (NADP(+)) [Yamadazyma tenuis]